MWLSDWVMSRPDQDLDVLLHFPPVETSRTNRIDPVQNMMFVGTEDDFESVTVSHCITYKLPLHFDSAVKWVRMWWRELPECSKWASEWEEKLLIYWDFSCTTEPPRGFTVEKKQTLRTGKQIHMLSALMIAGIQSFFDNKVSQQSLQEGSLIFLTLHDSRTFTCSEWNFCPSIKTFFHAQTLI